jgi:hypothetical protein
MKFSNNTFVLEPYKTDKSLKATVNNGFAMISQKINLIALTVKVATTYAGKEVPAGSKAYIKEEILHTAQWATKALEAEGVEGNFILAPPTSVEFVDTGDSA